MEPLTTLLAFMFFGFIASAAGNRGETIRIVPRLRHVDRAPRPIDKVASSGLNLLIPFWTDRAFYWTNTRPA